jgi:hypothetical protein
VSAYLWQGCSDINIFINGALLKNACASWPFYSGCRQPATLAVRKVSGEHQNPKTIADNAKAFGYLFARLAGLRDARKATAHALYRHRADL